MHITAADRRDEALQKAYDEFQTTVAPIEKKIENLTTVYNDRIVPLRIQYAAAYKTFSDTVENVHETYARETPDEVI